jgi:hypothetical protein
MMHVTIASDRDTTPAPHVVNTKIAHFTKGQMSQNHRNFRAQAASPMGNPHWLKG